MHEVFGVLNLVLLVIQLSCMYLLSFPLHQFHPCPGAYLKTHVSSLSSIRGVMLVRDGCLERERIMPDHVTLRKPPTRPPTASTIYRHLPNVLSRTILMLRNKRLELRLSNILYNRIASYCATRTLLTPSVVRRSSATGFSTW